MNPAQPIQIEVSPGELWDKITILRLKAARIVDAAKLKNVRSELAMLETTATASLETSPTFDGLIAKLAEVNARLWGH